MPTKPVDSYTWDSNETNEAPPTAEHAADGYAADEIPASNEWNGMFRINGEVSAYVVAASSGGEEDQHLVETDAEGVTAIAKLDAGPPLLGHDPDNYAISAAGALTGGSGVVATGGGTYPGITATGGESDGNGVEGTGVGLGHGIVGQGGEAGSGVVGTAGNGGDAGVQGIGAGGSPGVLGTVTTTGNGVQGTGGTSTGYGVRGIAGNASWSGVRGESHASGTTTGAAVSAYALGSAIGLYAQSADGYAIVAAADLTSPARAALRLAPQNVDPSTVADGDVWANSTTNDFRVRIDGSTKTIWGTPSGLVHGAHTGQSATNNNSAAWTDLCTVTLSSPYDPRRTGTVLISASAEFGAAGGTTHPTFDVRIYDNTASSAVWSRTIANPASAGSTIDRPWRIELEYSLPLVGSRVFVLQFRRIGGGGTGVAAQDASLVVRGVF